ncbi:MAG: hypothetical protein M1821_000379 [Bathelium mastoideum]|nr:MAG: hypothetical protein M1821_000379 [Bathelium mastoideum]
MRFLDSFTWAILAVPLAFSFPFEVADRSSAATDARQVRSVHGSAGKEPPSEGDSPFVIHLNEEIEIEGKVITPVRYIGKGGYGVVCEGDYQENAGARKQVVAIKYFKDYNEGRRKGLTGSELQAELDFPNVVRLLFTGHYEGTRYTLMIFEYAAGGDLWHILHGQGNVDVFDPRPSNHYYDKDMRDALWQAAAALTYIHMHDIYHNDFKLDNLLYFPNEPHSRSRIKLTDFDFAMEIRDPQVSYGCGNVYVASLEFMRLLKSTKIPQDEPEGMPPRSYNLEKNDVWSLGLVALYLITGTSPIPKTKDENAVDTALRIFTPIFESSDEERADLIHERFPAVSMPMCKLLADVFVPEERRIRATGFRMRVNNEEEIPTFRSEPVSQLGARALTPLPPVKQQGKMTSQSIQCIGKKP